MPQPEVSWWRSGRDNIHSLLVLRAVQKQRRAMYVIMAIFER